MCYADTVTNDDGTATAFCYCGWQHDHATPEAADAERHQTETAADPYSPECDTAKCRMCSTIGVPMNVQDPMTMGEAFAYLAEHGFSTTTSNRIHYHGVTGVRVVVDNPESLCVTVHAYSGTWRAQLTRAPFAVFSATVTAAIG